MPVLPEWLAAFAAGIRGMHSSDSGGDSAPIRGGDSRGFVRMRGEGRTQSDFRTRQAGRRNWLQK